MTQNMAQLIAQIIFMLLYRIASLRHAAEQEVQVGDHGQDEHQRGARRVEPPPGGGREVGALFKSRFSFLYTGLPGYCDTFEARNRQILSFSTHIGHKLAF